MAINGNDKHANENTDMNVGRIYLVLLQIQMRANLHSPPSLFSLLYANICVYFSFKCTFAVEISGIGTRWDLICAGNTYLSYSYVTSHSTPYFVVGGTVSPLNLRFYLIGFTLSCLYKMVGGWRHRLLIGNAGSSVCGT